MPQPKHMTSTTLTLIKTLGKQTNTIREGPAGLLPTAAISAKHYLGLDKFRQTDTDCSPCFDINSYCYPQTMADNTQPNAASSGEPSNGWTGTSHGVSQLPQSSNNFMRTYTFNRTFQNILKTTQMHQAKINFAKFSGTEEGYHSVG